jgi:anti-sigma factor RsiW
MKEHTTVQDLLALAAAGLLDPAEQRRVEEHLSHCEACQIEFDEWTRIAGALKELPTPQASYRLVVQTQRLLAHAAALQGRQWNRVGLVCLVLFSWMVTFVTFGLVQFLNTPLSRLLDISPTTIWAGFIGVTWLATAVAAGMLGKHWQQDGRTV